MKQDPSLLQFSPDSSCCLVSSKDSENKRDLDLTELVAIEMAEDRYLVMNPDKVNESVFYICDPWLLAHFLIGICLDERSCIVQLRVEQSIKKLFFRNGRLRFATSNLFDDRLGEVLYRTGRIDSDTLCEYATLVTKNNRFGQVLLDSGGYTDEDLRKLLVLQTDHIVTSLFLATKLMITIEPFKRPATEIMVIDTMTSYFKTLASKGAYLRSFQGRLGDSACLQIAEEIDWILDATPFQKDFLSLIKEAEGGVIELVDLLKASNIHDGYVVETLSNLVNNRVLWVTNPRYSTLCSREDMPSVLWQRLEAYEQTKDSVQDRLGEQKKEVPLSFLQAIVAEYDPNQHLRWYFDKTASLTNETIWSLAIHSIYSLEALAKICQICDHLMIFLIQTLENQGYGQLDEVRKAYQECQITENLAKNLD